MGTLFSSSCGGLQPLRNGPFCCIQILAFNHLYPSVLTGLLLRVVLVPTVPMKCPGAVLPALGKHFCNIEKYTLSFCSIQCSWCIFCYITDAAVYILIITWEMNDWRFLFMLCSPFIYKFDISFLSCWHFRPLIQWWSLGKVHTWQNKPVSVQWQYTAQCVFV